MRKYVMWLLTSTLVVACWSVTSATESYVRIKNDTDHAVMFSVNYVGSRGGSSKGAGPMKAGSVVTFPVIVETGRDLPADRISSVSAKATRQFRQVFECSMHVTEAGAWKVVQRGYHDCAFER